MIFQKLGFFGRIRRESNQFLRIFRATRGVANPQALASAGSPFATVYASGFRELQSQVGTGTGTGNPAADGKLRSLTAVNVSMQLASAEEVRRAEKGMSWLATTASVSPFIGLFGTVWGIIDAFSGLGAAGSASLRAVAPGISEALFTTAAGLATAIPAVIFYNHFLQSIRDLAGRLDTFSMEVAAQIEKTFS
jgi:biopolymer transport protein TolQ